MYLGLQKTMEKFRYERYRVDFLLNSVEAHLWCIFFIKKKQNKEQNKTNIFVLATIILFLISKIQTEKVRPVRLEGRGSDTLVYFEEN